MPKKYRPITQEEKTRQIGIGLLIALIFAIPIGFIAPILFQWVGGIFDPTPAALQDCKLSDCRDKPWTDYIACRANSNSYDARLERLSDKIPWFWIAFVLLGWTYTKNPLRGRIRDDSEDITYEGQGGMDFLLQLIFQAMFVICLWAFFIRSKTSFIALGIGIAVSLFWYVIHKWLQKKFGITKLERRSK